MKSRVLLALFGLAAATFVLAQAQEPTKKPIDKGTQIREDLTLKEQILARQFAEFEQSLLKLKQRLERSPKQEDRDRAVILDKALEQAKKSSIGTQFEQFVDFLKGQKLKSVGEVKTAVERSSKLAEDLRMILALLQEDTRAAKKRDERISLEKLIKELEKVIQDQKIAETITRIGKTDKSELIKIQNKITKATADLAKKMGGKGEGKKGESKDSGAEGKKGAGKDGGKKDGDNKPGEAKAGAKGAQGEKSGEGKEGEAKGSKGGQGKEGAKGSKSGQGKQGEAKESKGGQGKEGGAKDAGKEGGVKEKSKQGEAKGGEKKSSASGNPGQGKQGEAKSGGKKGSESKEGGAKASKGGESKSGDAKSGGKSGKQGEAKSGSKSSGQGQAKSGAQKSGQQPDSKAAKNQPPQPPQPPQQNVANGKKQVEDGNYKQNQAEEKIAKDDNKGADDDMNKAIKDLEAAKKKLEDLLNQIREEELERLLAALQARCEKMLAMQMAVLTGTEVVFASINGHKDKKAARIDQQQSLKLSDDEKEIVTEATKAIEMLEAEGSAVAFPEVFKQVREDMKHVQRRLGVVDSGTVTQAIEKDIIDTLKEMIEALKKARQELDNKKNPPSKAGQPPPNQDQKLLDQIAELKMIRSMQIRVNKRTEVYGAQIEQSADQNVIQELRNLSERQERIFEVTNRIAKGDNK